MGDYILSNKQKIFIREYCVNGFNATQKIARTAIVDKG
jgi:hypothetical protein